MCGFLGMEEKNGVNNKVMKENVNFRAKTCKGCILKERMEVEGYLRFDQYISRLYWDYQNISNQKIVG